MDKEEIREEIARVLSRKSSVFHDLSGIKPNDFTFVKCANQKSECLMEVRHLMHRESVTPTLMAPSMCDEANQCGRARFA